MRVRHAFALIAAMSLLLIGCTSTATQSTGGGWITSVNGVDQANFGYSFNCGKVAYCGSARASGQYDDHGVGVRFKVDSVGTLSASTTLTSTCNTANITYSSMDPARPGTGTATVTACDSGKGSTTTADATVATDTLDLVVNGITVGGADTLEVTVSTGPLAPYYNAGALQGGNITIR